MAPSERDDAQPGWSETDWDGLFRDDQAVWAVVDGVSWPDISRQLARSELPHVCLYSTLNPDTRALAPWLVQLEPFSAFTEILRRRLHGAHSYILLKGRGSFEEMRSHLRRFTMIRVPTENEAPVYFRFYDPRVLIDAIETLSESFRSRFMRNLTEVLAPISAFCLVPDSAALSKPMPTPFSDDESCQGRLLRWRGQVDLDQTGYGPAAVTTDELAKLQDRMRIRASHKLAREMFTEFGEITSQARCESIAKEAANAAARFGFLSVKQVQVFARAQLLFGHDFYRRHSKASDFLYDPTLLEWQKKDRLERWLEHMLTDHGYRGAIGLSA